MITDQQCAEFMARKVADLSMIIPGFVSCSARATCFDGQVATEFRFSSVNDLGAQVAIDADCQAAIDKLIAKNDVTSVAGNKRAQAAKLLADVAAMEKEAA